MKSGVRVLATAVAVAALGVGAAATAGAQDAPPGDVTKGKQVYLSDHCFTCHGRAGQGGALNGPAPRLAKTIVPFDGFKGQIRNPSHDMPAYPDAILSDQQVADIYAYLQTLSGPLPAKDIPAILND
jgi:mono/diheme cytochrome c family protein